MNKKNSPGEAPTGHHYKYYDFIMVAFVTLLILSNLVGAGKVAVLNLPFFGNFEFGAGVLFFPLSYVIGDVLTEVYGYARARRVVWAGFVAMVFMSVATTIIVELPPAVWWGGQEAYTRVFGQTWRIVAASMVAFWAGEFANAYVMAKMKIASMGQHLWQRTIGSTIVGQGFDSLLFYPLAFWGIWPDEQVLFVLTTNFLIKVVWEALLTPVTYKTVSWLKYKEEVDHYDDDTNFTPFKLRAD